MNKLRILIAILMSVIALGALAMLFRKVEPPDSNNNKSVSGENSSSEYYSSSEDIEIKGISLDVPSIIY